MEFTIYTLVSLSAQLKLGQHLPIIFITDKSYHYFVNQLIDLDKKFERIKQFGDQIFLKP